MTNLSRVDVVIPALNEEASVGMVLGDLPQVRRVILVDNGSTDTTAEVAAANGATVVSEPRRGYGSACLRGLSEIENRIASGEPAPEIVVFIDADYSDHPEELAQLVAPIFLGEADFVLGSRILGNRERGAMPPQSVYGNKLACFLMKALFGASFTDLGPFRAIRYSTLRSLNMVDTNFGWTIEMQIKAARRGVSFMEIPVQYRRRTGVSKISGTISGTFKAGTKILWTVARYARKPDSPVALSDSSSSVSGDSVEPSDASEAFSRDLSTEDNLRDTRRSA